MIHATSTHHCQVGWGEAPPLPSLPAPTGYNAPVPFSLAVHRKVTLSGFYAHGEFYGMVAAHSRAKHPTGKKIN